MSETTPNPKSGAEAGAPHAGNPDAKPSRHFVVAGLSEVWGGVKKRALEGIVFILLAGAGAAFWASWDSIQSWVKRFVVSATVEELSRENNQLIEPIKKTLAKLRSSEIGALNVGNFVLTPANPQYVLPIYMPDKHEGQISVILSGYLVPKKFYVRVILPSGKNIDITSNETTIDLAKSLRAVNTAIENSADDLILRPSFIKGLRTLTFQLVQMDDVPAQPSATSIEREIRVRYLALVSPTISLGSMP